MRDAATGDPVAGAVATLAPPGPSPPPEPTRLFAAGLDHRGDSPPTSDQGEVEVDLPIGRYAVRIQHPGYTTSVAQEVEIRPGTRAVLQERIAPTGWLVVRVRLPNGDLGRFVDIEYRREGNDEVREVRTVRQYEFKGIDRGVWFLRARALGSGSAKEWGPEQRVVIEARGRQEVELVTGR
jgi:hypothetical protein